MAEGRGVAILVGAGDAIGAAVARRFAKGGYTVCICRRDAAKSQGLVDEFKAAGLQPGGDKLKAGRAWTQDVPLAEFQIEGPVAVSVKAGVVAPSPC